MLIPHEDLFWRDYRAFMEAAAGQLDVQLTCYLAENNRELMKAQLRRVTSGDDRVDAVVFQNFKQVGEDLLAICAEAEVPAFLVNAGVPERCGAPRAENPHWLGTMVSDGVAAGRQLCDLLVDRALAQGLADDAGKVHMIGLAGIVSDTGSSDRVRGLEQAVAARDDVVLHQVVPTDWSREDGREKAAALLERFPHTVVVWTASDPLALAAVDVLKQGQRRPGEDVLVGGFDWTAEALEAVLAGELYTTIGGHFMEGGWVAVLLHDYFAGRDFASKGVVFPTPMQPITRENVERFLPAITGADWTRVDFKALTAPEGGYAFDAVATLEQLTE